MLWDLESKFQLKTEKRREEPEGRKRRETRNATRARTAWCRKGEDDYHIRK
jgi:predicted ATPase